MYPDERVVKFVTENFVPVRIHVKENPGGFKRFGAQWTPTVILADPGGTERYRFEGFLPTDEFIPQLELGLAKAAFANEKFDLAERRYRDIVARFPEAEVAPEALYWAGVSKYKDSNDAQALGDTFRAFQSRYSDSVWAKKAAVWAG